jgi:histidinol-phosphatase (PHP family)
MIQYPIGDSHVHPDFSIDARGSIRDYCQRAFEIGLYEITFTTHYEILPDRKDQMGFFRIDGKEVPAGPEAVKRYIDEVRTVGEEFFPSGLKVGCGLEVGWDRRVYDRLAKDLEAFDLDFVIGSVHDVLDTPILEREFGPQFFANHPIDFWIGEYFRLAEEIAESELFDVFGHFDCYKRFGLVAYGDAIKTAHEPFAESLFAKMKQHNLYMELNTAGIRHNLGEYYPSMSIVNAARQAGVRISSLGSDAHNPEQLGFDFENASLLVHELLPCGPEDDYDH